MSLSDRVVLVLALALLPYLYATFWGDGGAGEAIEISVAGQRPVVLPLAENRHYTVQGALGPSVLEIKDGQVRFLASPCRGKQCIHTGWLRHSGEAAACLPNRVSVRITGLDPRYDAINF